MSLQKRQLELREADPQDRRLDTEGSSECSISSDLGGKL
jgi:hypothetical protein